MTDPASPKAAQGTVTLTHPMLDDSELLRRYAVDRDESAFAELAQRHLGFVYHAALRQCGGDAHRAEDVAQLVFADLARKAAKLARRPVLAGWLYTSTRYAAAQAVRTEVRRQTREQEAHAMNELLTSSTAEIVTEWERLRPVIDDALHALGERDREAVLLRFFEGRAFAEVGAKLAVSEDAARMRVDRALDLLRSALARRGVTSTTSALALALANQAGAAAPAGLVASVTAAVLAGAAPAGGAAAALGVWHFMSTTKFIAAAAGLLTLLAVGTAVYEANAARGVVLSSNTEREALRTRIAALEKRVQEAERNRAAAPIATTESGAPPAPAPTPSRAMAPVGASAPSPADEQATLASAKNALAHIGNPGRDARAQDFGFDEASLAAIRAWMKQDPKAALEWIAALPADRNQRMHTIEAFIAIEKEADPELAFLLANSIGLATSRVARLVDVVKEWAPRDRTAVIAAVQSADVSPEERAFLLKRVELESRSGR